MPAGAIDSALVATPQDIGTRLLALPEDQWFDRKSFRIAPRKLAESLVAFANADGGTIVVGLSENNIEGVDSGPGHLNKLMQTAINFTQPMVIVESRLYDCVRQNGKLDHLLIIEIPPGGAVYATNEDEVFLRIGDSNRKLNFIQRRELLYNKPQSNYEAEKIDATIADVHQSLLEEYVRVLEAPDSQRLLEARGLASKGNLTVAGLLLFGEHPEQKLPAARVRISRFSGTNRESGSRQNLVGDKSIEGPIPLLLDKARLQIREWQPKRSALGSSGKFEDVGIIPEDAWLEGLVNAVVHRSYSIYGDYIHVNIYDDRITIESPGRFPGLNDLTNPLGIARFARNPRIARVCTDLRITQELGEGIQRIYDEMRKAGLSDPIYNQTPGSVRLTLSGEVVVRRLVEQLPVPQQHILALIRESTRLSTGEIVQLTGLARPTVIRHLNMLLTGGFIEWNGKSTKDPRASWRILR